MTREIELTIDYLKNIQEGYIEEEGFDRYPLPEWYALDNAIKALEQKPILDRDCEHCSKTYGTLGCCDTVSNEWVYSCKEGQREYILDKIRAEIEQKIEQERFARSVFRGEEKDVVKAHQCTGSIMAYNNVIKIIDKYKAESEENDYND